MSDDRDERRWWETTRTSASIEHCRRPGSDPNPLLYKERMRQCILSFISRLPSSHHDPSFLSLNSSMPQSSGVHVPPCTLKPDDERMINQFGPHFQKLVDHPRSYWYRSKLYIPSSRTKEQSMGVLRGYG